MSKEYVSLAIAIVGILVQFAIAYIGVRRCKKHKLQAIEALDKATKKRKAAVTILEFANLWRQHMTEDERMNLIIEWHSRLAEANVYIGLDDD